MAPPNDALSGEGVLVATGEMLGLKDVLSSVVHDTLQEFIEGIHPDFG
jgi:hypothetical protein